MYNTVHLVCIMPNAIILVQILTYCISNERWSPAEYNGGNIWAMPHPSVIAIMYNTVHLVC